MVLIGSLSRVVQRNKTHLFTIWIPALKLPVKEDTSVKIPNSAHVEAHKQSFETNLCRSSFKHNRCSSCTLGTAVFLLNWIAWKKRERQGKLQILWRFVRMAQICYTLFSFVFLIGSYWPIIQQMAHWREVRYGMHGKFHQVWLCRLHSWAPLSRPWESPESTCFDLTKLEFQPTYTPLLWLQP